jgi:hypothetical protein
MPNLKLPEIIELSHYRGNFDTYMQAVYDIFVNDFIHTKPVYCGIKLGLKRFPIVDGKEYTFYHMTHSGDIESERIPDLRRMEAVPWPKPMINDSTHPDLRVWQNIRRGTGGTKSRILILNESTNYLVVLDRRDTFILPWTAYFVGNKQKTRLLNEYETYIKAETAKN